MKIEYIPEMYSVLLAVLLFPIVPLVHIILSRITKSLLILKHTLIGSIPYILIWFIIIFYVKHHFLINNIQFIRIVAGGVCTIGFIVLGYMELISQPFRGFSLELLVNIYLNESFNNKIQSQNLNIVSKELMKDRIHIMKKLNIVYTVGEELCLTPTGKLLSKIGINLKKFFKMTV